MRFWLREIAGWALLAIGLYLFYYCALLLLAAQIVQGVLLSGVGFIIFRGGIHLLKIAAAAQVCLDVQDKLRAAAKAKPARPVARRPILPFLELRDKKQD